jgi:hypothetical protein
VVIARFWFLEPDAPVLRSRHYDIDPADSPGTPMR